MRKLRSSNWFAGMAILLGIGAPGAVQAQEPQIEKIPLQYLDARYVALLLGGRTLPMEADLWMGRTGPFGGALTGPAGGGVAPGNGVLADPATNSLLVAPGFQFGNPPRMHRLFGDPGSNSLLVGPQGAYRTSGVSPQNRLYGVPGSNSLLYRYRR
jgi:hypothetical protein